MRKSHFDLSACLPAAALHCVYVPLLECACLRRGRGWDAEGTGAATATSTARLEGWRPARHQCATFGSLGQCTAALLPTTTCVATPLAALYRGDMIVCHAMCVGAGRDSWKVDPSYLTVEQVRGGTCGRGLGG